MEVVSECVLPVGSVLWAPRPSTWALTVVCKATFSLLPGEARLADEQEGINEEDNHWDDDPVRSIYAASDLVPQKPSCDVLLVGNAFVPRGKPMSSFLVRLITAGVDKSIEVHGERFLLSNGRIAYGSPMSQVPLRYERAAGGPGTANPVGMRAEARDDRGALPLPLLQRPGCPVHEAFAEPVGFGPIAPLWPDRRSKALGAAGWTMAMWRAAPIPPSVEPAFFNVAPCDQQVETIRPDEPLVMENLDREHERLLTQLPGIVPRARVERPGRTSELRLVADTLWIDTDRGIATVTWRGHVPLDSPQAQGRAIIGLERPRPAGRHSYPDIEASGSAGAPQASAATSSRPGEEPTDTTLLPVWSLVPTLPFSAASGGTPALDAAPRAAPRARSSAEETRRADEPPAIGPALPFNPTPESLRDTPQPAPVPATPALADGSPWAGGAPVRSPQTVGDSVMSAGSDAKPPPAAPATPLPPAVVRPAPVEVARTAPEEAAPAPDKPKVGSLALFKRLPPPVPAAVLSAAAASDAAAGPQAHAAPGPFDAQVGPAPQLPAVALELLWLDPAFMPLIRRQADWADIITTIKPKPRDADFQEGTPSPARQEAKDRREISGVLAKARPETTDGLHVAFARAIDEDGRFEPPLVVVGGELELPFDELEMLKATVAVVSPLVGPEDKRLKDILGAAQEAVRSSWGHMAERLTEQLREALARDQRAALRSIDTHVERLLFEGRHLQKRTLLGQPWVRGMLSVSSGGSPVPAYIPAAPARELPAMQRISVRLIADVHAQLDQHEAQPIALRVIALGRVISSAFRR